MDVCFYDADGNETDCVTLRERTAFVWHGFIRDIKPGQLYNYRVHGPWDPEHGMLFNPAKSLVDPYAKAIAGQLDWKAPIFPYDVASGDPLKIDEQDSANGVPKSVVIHDPFDWSDDRKPETPLPDSVIYETHVKGFSFRNPDIPENLRGTYAGLAHPSSIEYFKNLGITAVELLADSSLHRRRASRRKGAARLLGLQHAGILCAHVALQLVLAIRAGRCASSRRW